MARGRHDGAVPAPVAPLPEPPAASFASDNAAGALPEVLDALVAASEGPALAYGEDPWTARLAAELDERFGRSVEVLLCWGGTGANVVGLATAVRSWQAVICPHTAHIVVDECGAPTRFLGAPLLTVEATDGKIDPSAVEPYLAWLGDRHHPQPAVVSVSQATEEGTTYAVDELAALCQAAHAHGLRVHVDGARLANALAAHGTDLASMIAEAGVDVLTLGATKAGAVYGEAVVLLDPALAEGAAFHHKQAGQLPSKARFIAAQLLALLEGDRWVGAAAHANALAARLAEGAAGIPGVEVLRPPQVNSVFARIPEPAVAPLQAWTPFWPWGTDPGVVRWMTSWATTETDVDTFLTGVRQVVAHHTA